MKNYSQLTACKH